MATVTADSLYQLIKHLESTFPLPAPYVTVDVGTFDAATGAFRGLTTRVDSDPEPIEHGPHDHRRNPPPRFVGEWWQQVTVDSHWRQTVTLVPAPKVSLAPVLLRFAIENAATSWSVTIGGFTTSAPAGQTTLSISIWDRTIVHWRIEAGASSYGDELRIQRPGGLSGAGAFTIPVIPVAVIYAPPADSLKQSVGTYGVSDTIGTTVSYEFSTESSETVPQTDIGFTTFTELKSGLEVASQALALAGQQQASSVLSDISSELGTLSETEQSDKLEGSGNSLTVTDTRSESISTKAIAGGPGVGDTIVFYKNVRVAWLYHDGRLRLWPFGHTKVALPAAKLQSDLSEVEISSDDQQRLLSLDPFVAGGPTASLPLDRFTMPDGGEVSLEYGGGVEIDRKLVKTRETKTTTTQKTSTTETSSWDPGPRLKLLGIGGDKTEVTTTTTNATADDVSSTVSLEANLVAGPDDYFVVTIWFDQLFGTWAFQQGQVAPSPLVSGGGAQPGEVVRLEVADRAYVTVADAEGRYVFRAESIPGGPARLAVGTGQPLTVNITGRPDLPPPAGSAPRGLEPERSS